MSDNYNIYDDINKRTNGEIYIGVVGPVRTGKSTFIKNFMQTYILPNIENNMIDEMLDELPQSANGTMIMTTEPKFIPKEGINIPFGNSKALLRMIDCVGFPINGATGFTYDDKERMVKTPWYDYEIPFSEAAKVGTKRVIDEHSTVAVVVTSDGTFGEIERDNFNDALDTTIYELNNTKKPYIIILNSALPTSRMAIDYADELSKKYNSKVIPMDVIHLSRRDIDLIFETIIKRFPITEIVFNLPTFYMLPNCENEYNNALDIARNVCDTINDISSSGLDINSDELSLVTRDLSTGQMVYDIHGDSKTYYDKLSNIWGENISNEKDLLSVLIDIANKKEAINQLNQVVYEVDSSGYGYILGDKEKIVLKEPVLIKDGNKYGVSITAVAPSMHIIKTDITTNISPIIGEKKEADDLIEYIKNSNDNEDGIWNTNIFGKTIEQTIMNSINQKVSNMTNENVEKIKGTMEKVINENNGLVCLIV